MYQQTRPLVRAAIAAPGPVPPVASRPIPIRAVPRAGIKALVERLVASGAVERPRAEGF